MILVCGNQNQSFHAPKAERLLRGFFRSCRTPAHGILQSATVKRWNNKRRPALERFWEKVDKRNHDGCWIWTGSIKDEYHYGRISVGKKDVLSHRYSWIVNKGPIPHGLCVLHKCDNPQCVNPDHFFLGTQAENIMDMFSKGRNPTPKRGKDSYLSTINKTGEKNLSSKLTESQVIDIRSLYDSGIGYRPIAGRFCVTYQNIKHIVMRKTWKHI